MKTCLGFALLRDEKGEEMHKSKGNAIWFDEAAERAGVDVMRWLYLKHNPAQNLNFGWRLLDEVRRTFLLPLWNSYAFFANYARLDGFDPRQHDVPLAERASSIAGSSHDCSRSSRPSATVSRTTTR